jgi:hypothetical protein
MAKRSKSKTHKGFQDYSKGDGKMSKMAPRIKAAVKKGESIAAIAKRMKKSYSYVWVMARNYKYNG